MYTAILLLPLLGAVIAGFFHRIIGEWASMVLTTGILIFCGLLSWIAFFTLDPAATSSIVLFDWIVSGDLQAAWSIRADRLTTVMLIVVTSVSALVHLYSIGYMEEDDAKPRFFAYLSFFTFAMLALVTGDNLLQIFFGWEGVGVASYLLIGFWYKKNSANEAAMKAFIVNRVGDFGFLLGMFALFALTGSIMLDDVFAAGPELAERSIHFLGMEANAAELVAILLFIGAMGKSAQLFLHTWLPDAMEGPTPVSALIHAATMVTAGVFLVCRMSPIFEYAPTALTIVMVVGASTALFAGSVGLVQQDIKRVIAYSTCSQLGYMFAAAGAGAYEAAMFHLFTHAFFKALLFLGAGSVIHAMHHEQNMFKMGGLKDKLPWTYLTMVIGTLAITGVGIPFLYLTSFEVPVGFAGFVSKEVVIWTTFAAGGNAGMYAYFLLSFGAVMTAFYSWRLIFLTFHGQTRADKHTYDHAHEPGLVMLIPLFLLAIGAVIAGMDFYSDFIGHHEHEFWGSSILNLPREQGDSMLLSGKAIHELAKFFPFSCMMLGAFLSWIFYVRYPTLPSKMATRHEGLYKFLLNKWYFDEVYTFIFVRPAMWIGRMLWKGGDGRTIDGIINGLAMGLVPRLTRFAGRMQSGYLFHYAFVMLIGISLLITWFAISGGAGGAE
ncbi:NADH-quinone oxidoreductase subunit L [Paralimibaculum aggregatum]|uniref:NADH-quinone oxidoreductase subunit L n=1 Tax=Paralimibaculum aggregatum TaxID=3036245 RepID=A0ABQ6LT41_9RHOB|nr:NADH-quinone oxidoreductase subunit L [Limibaculum sp. NKW23]GMG85221.1 NADH-quinone oxidoreductase subunit L [Limibaculum sp. NKW23]